MPQTVIITGASSGIGEALAYRAAELKLNICLAARNFEKLNQVKSNCERLGAQVIVVQADVQIESDCQRIIDETVSAFSGIDILINNAGITRDNILGLMTNEELDNVLATNVVGVFNVLRPVIPYMVSQRRGRIINISSVAGEKGGRGQTNYAASKGAINALTKALAVELAPKNILVNCVAPGMIETDMTESIKRQAGDMLKSRILLGRFGQPEDVAKAVLFFASNLSDYVTGQVLHVDGGFKMN